MRKLSIIIPCYNESQNISYIYNEIKNEKPNINRIEELEYEILFIDDGSKDNTIDEIKKLSARDSSIKYISFSRNFGKESAMYAGFKNATGDYIVIMDADGQDPVNLLHEMVSYIKTGDYECVATKRSNRTGEAIIRSFFAKSFYKVINMVSDTKIIDGARDYRMCTRKYVNSIVELTEYNRFSKGLFNWVGYKTKWLEYNNINRKYGKTKWSFKKLFDYSLDGIMAFSTTPLIIVSIIGSIVCLFSLAFFIYIIINKINGNPVEGWTSLACLITFIGGIIIFSIGIVSQYMAKMYFEIKKRPLYLINDNNIKGAK